MLNSAQMNIYCRNRRWSMTRRGKQPVLLLDGGEQWAMTEQGLWYQERERKE